MYDRKYCSVVVEVIITLNVPIIIIIIIIIIMIIIIIISCCSSSSIFSKFTESQFKSNQQKIWAF